MTRAYDQFVGSFSWYTLRGSNIFMIVKSSRGSGYIIPGAFNVVLGGTHENDDWNENADTRVRDTIRRNCTNLMPSLQDIKFSSDWIGLRPVRPTVRLELETVKSTKKKLMIVHNYGHAGSGVTLHWGCAKQAARLVVQAIHAQTTTAKL
ncbi:hypothetical protein ScPMuIL_005288 [Solemya velum]